ncbi:MAG: hypothetical protein PVG15_13870 [Desulfobacterales bacterium]|jgi:hypothetical protein
MANGVFQTGCIAPGFTRNDWGTSRPCLLPPMAVKSKPPALRVVVDSGPPKIVIPIAAKDNKNAS